jgi:hypothetical protein
MSNIGSARTNFPIRYPRREELRLILETALDAVVVMKPDGVVADWNDRAMDLFFTYRYQSAPSTQNVERRALFRIRTVPGTARGSATGPFGCDHQHNAG